MHFNIEKSHNAESLRMQTRKHLQSTLFIQNFLKAKHNYIFAMAIYVENKTGKCLTNQYQCLFLQEARYKENENSESGWKCKSLWVIFHGSSIVTLFLIQIQPTHTHTFTHNTHNKIHMNRERRRHTYIHTERQKHINIHMFSTLYYGLQMHV